MLTSEMSAMDSMPNSIQLYHYYINKMQKLITKKSCQQFWKLRWDRTILCFLICLHQSNYQVRMLANKLENLNSNEWSTTNGVSLKFPLHISFLPSYKSFNYDVISPDFSFVCVCAGVVAQMDAHRGQVQMSVDASRTVCSCRQHRAVFPWPG